MAQSEETGGESVTVLLRAFLANFGIAIAKFVAASMTGSAAMMSEGVHSLVDTVNELLLYYGKRRTEKAPDALHPLGYAREQYFWSFVVAELVFMLGGGVALMEGIKAWQNPAETVAPGVALGVLGIAALLEGWSLKAAIEAFNRERQGKPILQAFRDSTDSTTITVLLEDTAAMIGLAMAAGGIIIGHMTGNPRWDAAASILIGLALGVVAIILLTKAKHLLIGQVADPAIAAGVRRIALATHGVVGVGDVITMQQSVDTVIGVVAVDFDDALRADDVELLCGEIASDVARAYPQIVRGYVCPTPRIVPPSKDSAP